MPMQPPRACVSSGPHSTPNGTAETGFVCNACREKQSQGQKEHDQWRSQQPYRKLYNSAGWKHLREIKLHRNPLCEICEKENPPRYVPATVVDHSIDHDGRAEVFFKLEGLISMCKMHHDSRTASMHGFGSDNSELAPNTLPVALEHSDLADGAEAFKQKYNRYYKKQGRQWVLQPKDYKPLDKQE
jgi:hypothetical protein